MIGELVTRLTVGVRPMLRQALDRQVTHDARFPDRGGSVWSPAQVGNQLRSRIQREVWERDDW